VSGLQAHPSGTLVERALDYLRTGPAASPKITADILGIPKAPSVVAERLATALLGADPRVMRDYRGHWTLADPYRTSPRLADCTFAVVDVETTGSQPARSDRIMEIGVALVTGKQVRVALDRLLDPGRAVPWNVTRVTRITSEMVKGQPTFGEIADEVLSVLSGRVFVAHNLAFDWRFVAAELRRARDVVLDGPTLCTVKLARRLIPGLKRRGLDSVAAYYGVEIEHRHRAAGDALATAHVLVRLIEAAQDLGAETLEDLLALDARVKGKKTAGPTWMDAV